MSNFICSECGMTNIDCGGAGYKTPKEIELEKKIHILNEANMKLENELGQVADVSKKVERLQERLEEAERFVKHDAYAEGLSGWIHVDRHGVVHENNLASKYCEKYGLEPEHYSMYNLHKFKKIIYKEDIARRCKIYTHPSIQMKSLGYKVEYEELKSLGERWLFWVDDYIDPMPEYLEKWGVK